MARHPGHDRSHHRERLLLRLLPQRAVHAGRFRRDRKEDARDHRARQTLYQGDLDPRADQAGVPRQRRNVQGRTGRRDPGRPDHQDLQAGRLVRSVPRPAYDVDRQDRQRLQADEGRGRLLARRQQQSDADAHLRHGIRKTGRARRLSEADRGSREARPSQARPRARPVSFPGGRSRRGVLARQGLDHLPGGDRLYAPAARRRLQTRSMRRRFSTRRCGKPRAIGNGTARTCSPRSRPATRPRTSAGSC